MTVLCPNCRRAIRIPPDKAALPNLKARCGACQTVFVVAEASIASQGGIVHAFVDSWALLSIGCLLGRAVLKKAAELGLD
jgi:predicted Zn finger-like uncharacterized protein